MNEYLTAEKVKGEILGQSIIMSLSSCIMRTFAQSSPTLASWPLIVNLDNQDHMQGNRKIGMVALLFLTMCQNIDNPFNQEFLDCVGRHASYSAPI
jgi:hypothetical protein